MIDGQTARSRAHHFGPNRYADHYVYRCYDTDGDLLYIGCTIDATKRIAAHRRGTGGAVASRWLSEFMDRYEVEGPFKGRDAGREAERLAIQAEQPLFNYQQRAGINLAAWMTRNPIAEYLIERGRLDLALETVCSCWRETKDVGAFDSFCVPHRTAHEAGLTELTEVGAA
jgi:hypothetical protein